MLAGDLLRLPAPRPKHEQQRCISNSLEADPRTIEIAVKIQERRSRLFGLDRVAEQPSTEVVEADKRLLCRGWSERSSAYIARAT